MANVKIKKLSLTNYRNIKQADFVFDCESGQIEGRNRIGKTNIIEALAWLLTDKLLGDSSDIAKIKPLENTKAKVSVEGVFETGGVEFTLRKEFSENWVRHKGDSGETFEGHYTDYFVNGAKQNLKNFNESVAQLIGFGQKEGDVDLYQTLIDPFYFPSLCYSTNWKEARKFIIDMVGDVTNEEVFAKCPEALVAKADLENHKRQTKGGFVYDDAEAKKALKVIIDGAKIAVIGKKALIDEFAKAEKPEEGGVEFARSKIEEGNDAIAKLNSGDDSAYDAQIDKLQQSLIERQKAYSDSMKAEPTDNSRSRQAQSELAEKNQEAYRAKGLLNDAKFKKGSLDLRIGLCEDKRKQFIDRIHGVQKRIAEYEPNQECPTCHQKLPTEQIEKAKEAYMSNLKAEGDKIMKDGKANRAELDSLTKEREALNIGGLEEAANFAQTEAEKAKEAYDAALSDEDAKAVQPKADESIKAEIYSLNLAISDLREKKRTANQGVAQKIAEIRDGLKPFEETLDRQRDYETAQRGKAKAEAELNAELRKQADAESRQSAINLFVKTKLGLLDDHIAKVFGKIRFQLVSPNIRQGSYDEVCKPYVFDFAKGESTDALFDSGSKSEQVRTGAAIAKAIAGHFGYGTLPMVFDEGGEMDADSIAQMGEYMGSDQQIISVKVCDDFKAPTFIGRK